MKRITYGLMILCLPLLMSAQEITNDQWSMVTKRSASWCPPCGSWGWNLQKGIIDDVADLNTIVLTAHHSGDLQNTTAQALTNAFGGGGQPIFYLNTDDINATSSNSATKQQEVFDQIQLLNSFDAFIGMGVEAEYNSYKLKVSTALRPTLDLDNELYVGVYLVQDHIISFQQSQGNDADHRFVLRDQLNFDGNIYGELVSEGVFAADEVKTVVTEIDFTQEDLDTYGVDDLANLSVVVVVWNKNSNGTFFFNGRQVNVVEKTSNTADLDEANAVNAFYNKTSGAIVLSFEEAPLNNQIVQVFSLQGQLVTEGTHQSGQVKTNIEFDQKESGMYIIRLTDTVSQTSNSVKLMIQK